MSRVQFDESRVVLYYTDHLGRPRETLLMYVSNNTLKWISPHSNITVAIGSVETSDDGELYLKIPIK